jgi:hypothetical protein
MPTSSTTIGRGRVIRDRAVSDAEVLVGSGDTHACHDY